MGSSFVSIHGEVEFQHTLSNVFWSNATVSREYEVKVRDNADNPVRDARITLETPNRRVTHHTTDEDGMVRFTLWFQNRNYEDTWNLLVPQGDTVEQVPITLLTSTPIKTDCLVGPRSSGTAYPGLVSVAFHPP